MQSEKIDLLAKAVIRFQSMVTPVLKDSVNPFFKSNYADLAAVIHHIQAPLFACGLGVIQTSDDGEPHPVLVTTLVHESGQWISGRYPLIPSKMDPQGLASAHSYARRYALMAIVGLASTDDDGEAAMVRSNPSRLTPPAKPQSPLKPAAGVQSVQSPPRFPNFPGKSVASVGGDDLSSAADGPSGGPAIGKSSAFSPPKRPELR